MAIFGNKFNDNIKATSNATIATTTPNHIGQTIVAMSTAGTITQVHVAKSLTAGGTIQLALNSAIVSHTGFMTLATSQTASGAKTFTGVFVGENTGRFSGAFTLGATINNFTPLVITALESAKPVLTKNQWCFAVNITAAKTYIIAYFTAIGTNTAMELSA